MEFSEKLIHLRKAKGLSQEQLGNELDVTRQTISKWETGITTPEMGKLIELSRLFDISIDELVGNEPSTQAACAAYPPLHRYRYGYEYKSKRQIGGLPLLHINLGYGLRRAKGVIAIGNIATGFFALGGLAAGAISFGGLGVGALTLGGLALGLLLAFGGIAVGAVAVGGLAIGLFAMGGCAIGIYSIGGFALAQKIAMGGYASGHIAIGDRVNGAVTFFLENGRHIDAPEQIQAAIFKEFPGTWKLLADLFSILS